MMKRYWAVIIAMIVIGISAAVYAQESTKPAAPDNTWKADESAKPAATAGATNAVTPAAPESAWSIKPATHDATWIRAHGQESKVDVNACLACHTDRVDCIKCHQEVQPRSHAASWLRTGHGLEARWNRDKCLACHTEDSCVDCHNNTLPSSHRSGWGGPGQPVNIHCQNCHFPLIDTGCFTCHKTSHTPQAVGLHSSR